MEEHAPFDSQAYYEELIRRATQAEQRRVAALRRQLKIERGVFLALILLMVAVIWRMAGPREPCAISVNGHRVVTVASTATADAVLADLKRELAGKGLERYAEFREQIGRTQLRSARASDPVVSPGEAAEALRARLHVVVPAYGILVNGQPGVVLPTRTLALRCLNLVRSKYDRRGRSQPVFREQVKIVRAKAGPRQVITKLDQAAAALISPRGQGRSYTVRAGDSGWLIANRAGMTLAELEKENPGVNLARLKVGQVLRLGPGRPLLTVVTSDIMSRVEPMAYATEITHDPSLDPGERRVIRAGKPGKRITEYRLVCYNGKEVSREVVDQRIETLPTSERVAVGK